MEKNVSQLLKKLLLRQGSKTRLWTALAALTVGTTLLFLSVLIWWNFNQLLQGKGDNDSLGSAFLTVSKRVTSEKAGRPELTVFSSAEIDELRKVEGVQDVGVLLSNDFPLVASLGGDLQFYTMMFLEAAPDRFMDKKPASWKWEPGNTQVPIILSSEFLNLYNYGFAISQGLPQLSETTIKSLPFKLTVGTGTNAQEYIGQIVGFSDRIQSILVPEAFINYANQQYGSGHVRPPSRLIVKVADPSGTAFNEYLKTHDYATNTEQLILNKLRTVANNIVLATGILAILLMGVSILTFLLFIELTIARAQESVRLLLQLGYSPKALGKFLFRKFLPLLSGALIIALLLALSAQAITALSMQKQKLTLSFVPGWPLWGAFGMCLALLLWQLKRGINIALKRV